MAWALPDYAVVVATDGDADAVSAGWGLDGDALAQGPDGSRWDSHGARRLLVRPTDEPVLATAMGMAWTVARRHPRAPVVAIVAEPDPNLTDLLALAARWQLPLLAICELTDPHDRAGALEAAIPNGLDIGVTETGQQESAAAMIRRLADRDAGSATGLAVWSQAVDAPGEPAGPASLGSRRRAAPPPTIPPAPDELRRRSPSAAPETAPQWASSDLDRVVIARPDRERHDLDELVAPDVVIPAGTAGLEDLVAIATGVALAEGQPVLSISADDLTRVVAALDDAPDHRSTDAVRVVVAPAHCSGRSLVPTPAGSARAVIASPSTAEDAAVALDQHDGTGGPLLLAAPSLGTSPTGGPTDGGTWTGSVRRRREGRDLTVVGHGDAVAACLAGAELVEADLARSVDVLELGIVHPLDLREVLASVRRTGRCLVVEDERSPVTVLHVVAAAVAAGAPGALQGPVGTLVVGSADPRPVAAAIERTCGAGEPTGATAGPSPQASEPGP